MEGDTPSELGQTEATSQASSPEDNVVDIPTTFMRKHREREKIVEKREEFDRKCSESLIATLQEALDQAKEGHVAAVGLAITRPGGGVDAGFSDAPSVEQLIAASSVLQDMLLRVRQRSLGNDLNPGA